MIRIDARGLKCPWPALRAARALREADAVRIIADDPAAERELAALASAQAVDFLKIEPQVFDLVRVPVNRSFTDQE